MTDYPETEICIIPEGTYRVGDDTRSTSRPSHTITLKTVAISKTATTNQAFAYFINAGGYEATHFWTEMGWRWQRNRQVSHPAFWEDPQFNHPLQPVVGVTWYEAQAYVKWLGHATTDAWRLPSEVEWEAATLSDAPINPRHINSAEKGIRRTWAAIGRGAVSRFGVRDMLGNVWEWTASRWGRNWQSLDYPYPYDPNDGREDLTGSHARVMRGGSWFDPLKDAHSAHRGRYLPGSRASNIGFRIAKAV